MVLGLKRRSGILAGLGILGVLVAGSIGFRISRQVSKSLEASTPDSAPLQLAPLPAPSPRAECWGSGNVEAVALTPSSLLSAGGFGIKNETEDLSAGLPTLRASALTLWRGNPILGLESGGLFLRREGRWEEVRTGFGILHVRTLLESPGGELYIGAREGLFQAAWAANRIERLDPASVRCLALEGGILLAGGEQGLRRIEGRRSQLLTTPDPWVDAVGLRGRDVWIQTTLGLARGPLEGPFAAIPGGEEAQSSAQDSNGTIWIVAEERLLRFDQGRAMEERVPSPPRRILNAAGILFLDTDAGLFRRSKNGWTLARPRPAGLPSGPFHVTALAPWREALAVGLFDGGLLLGEGSGRTSDVTLGKSTVEWHSVPGSAAWGVNALLGTGGSIYIASLRGAARFDGRSVKALDDSEGASFSLASTSHGVAVGYGQGLMLPGSRFLSAFHGLPGNQILALVPEEADHPLFAGTPSGLGAVSQGRVLWRAGAGDMKLPHPWVTGLAWFKGQLYVGTYGGGAAKRVAPQDRALDGSATDRSAIDKVGHFEPFLETGNFKVNTGCLVEAGGRLFLGTDGQGLLRLKQDASRFIPLNGPALPSANITALQAMGDWLYIGTPEGLARIPMSTAVLGD